MRIPLAAASAILALLVCACLDFSDGPVGPEATRPMISIMNVMCSRELLFPPPELIWSPFDLLRATLRIKRSRRIRTKYQSVHTRQIVLLQPPSEQDYVSYRDLVTAIKAWAAEHVGAVIVPRSDTQKKVASGLICD